MLENRVKLIEIKNLTKNFPIKKGFWGKICGNVQAVSDLSLDIHLGETVGLVGESGCGKSTTGRCILKLINPTSGKIFFEQKDISNLPRNHRQYIRKNMQIIFQNPYSSLNPRMNVQDIIAEPLRIHKNAFKCNINTRVNELVDMVGLSRSYLKRYPHEFSGGQRQRIGIARSLALNPKFIVADEPLSALDVSIQAQIINLLKELKQELGLTYLFISHNLSVVNYMSDRVAVMYLGQIMEIAHSNQLYMNPNHPYTEALLSAIPVPDPDIDSSNRILLSGDIPSPQSPPTGCRFNTRCNYVQEICTTTEPEFVEVSPEHFSRCHFAKSLSLKGINY